MYAAKVRPLEEMSCLFCVCDSNEKRDRTAPSDFHFKILKSRMLLFGLSRALVSPDPDDNLRIVVVFVANSDEASAVRGLLMKLNLKVERSARPNLALLKMCFEYTLKAKLAPLWNPMDGNVLAKGRNFLTATDSTEAVRVDVCAGDEVIMLQVRPCKFRMRQLDLSDLNVSNRASEYFSRVSDAALSEYSLMDQWVYVLPSLKKGKIVNINKKFRASTSFKSYKEIRRHWKNIYGYRLPEDESELLFYDVHFRPSGPCLFTYPSVCLRPNLPVYVTPPLDREEEILRSFLHDVKLQLPYILGNETKFGYFDPALKLLPSNIYRDEPMINFKTFENTQNISLCTPSQKLLNGSIDTSNSQLPNENVNFGIESNEICSSINSQHLNKLLPPIKPTFIPRKNLNVQLNNKLEDNENSISITDKIINSNLNNKPHSLNIFNNTQHSLISCIPKNVEIINQHMASFSNTYKIMDLCNEQQNRKILNTNDDSSSLNKLSQLSCNAPKNISPEMNAQTMVSSYFNSVKLGTTSSKKVPLEKIKFETLSPIIKTKKRQSKKIIDVSNINIPEIVKRDPNELKKLNVMTLYSWLCEQNVRLPKKSVKQTLLDKIIEIVGEHQQ